MEKRLGKKVYRKMPTMQVMTDVCALQYAMMQESIWVSCFLS